MLEYKNVYFNWFDDIREYKYFLQLLPLIVCNGYLFSCWHVEALKRQSFIDSIFAANKTEKTLSKSMCH